jgi:hypothetical protein
MYYNDVSHSSVRVIVVLWKIADFELAKISVFLTLWSVFSFSVVGRKVSLIVTRTGFICG